MQAPSRFRFVFFLSMLLVAVGGLAAPALAQNTPISLTFTGDQAAKFQQIHMIDATSGWAVVGIPHPNPDIRPGQTYTGTYAHVLHTQDGGQTWIDVSPPTPFGDSYTMHYLPCDCSDNGLLKYVFLDDQHAWIANDRFGIEGNQIYNGISVWATSDGGATWKLSPVIDAITALWMRFIDADHGWLMVGGQPQTTYYAEPPSSLYRTEDGGGHWEMIADDGVNQHYYPIRDPISSPETGIIDAKHTGMAFDSLESGWITWTPVDPQYGKPLHSSDGGATWHIVDIPDDPHLPGQYNSCLLTNAQALAPGSALFVATCFNYDESARYNWLYQTDDAGESWQSEALPNLMLVYDENTFGAAPQVMMLDATTGWMIQCAPPTDAAACDDPAARSLAQTLDGGATWTTLAPLPAEIPVLVDIVGGQRVSFVDAAQGWAVDSDGGLMTTSDGGITWTALTPTIAPVSS